MNSFPSNVLVIDDHPLFCRALTDLLNESCDCTVLYASTAEEGLRLLRAHIVHLVLLDIGLPGVSGVDAIHLIRKTCGAPIIVVSASVNRTEISAVLRSGASAVVSKGVSLDTLRVVVRQALRGSLPDKKWLQPTGEISLTDEGAPSLTRRHKEIAAMLMLGYSNKEIGIRLGLAEITIKSHLSAMFRVLGVVNRTQAVLAIRKLGVEYTTKETTRS